MRNEPRRPDFVHVLLPVVAALAVIAAVAATWFLVPTLVGAAPAAAPPAPAPPAAGGAAFPSASPVPTPASPPHTTVSLTFDDGAASQLLAIPALHDNGMRATFYVNSGTIDTLGYLERDDLDALAAAGHEIGGHTVNHADLSAVAPDEAARQICDDRRALTQWGFDVRSFAYPFGAMNDAAVAAVEACGYRSARLLGDIASRFTCEGCVVAETIPPPGPFTMRALAQVDQNWTLADLQQGVLNAETTGGWVQFTFHGVCTHECSSLDVEVDVLAEFLAWLAPRGASHGTSVVTVGDVIGGDPAPAVAGPISVPAGTAQNAVVNGGYEELGGDGLPRCWMRNGWGLNTASFVPAEGRDGSAGMAVTVGQHRTGGALVVPRFDLGGCSPAVIAGRSYSLRSWYTSTTLTQFSVYTRDESGTWDYWTSGPWFPASERWTQAEWTTEELPAGTTGISFGLLLFDDGTLVTDDVSMYDSFGAPPVDTGAATVSPPDEPTEEDTAP